MSKYAGWTVVVLTLACGVLGAPNRAVPSDGARIEEPSTGGLDALPWPDRIALERALAEHQAEHQPRIENGTPTLGDAARFHRAGEALAKRRIVIDDQQRFVG